jgi:hypothetical protein
MQIAEYRARLERFVEARNREWFSYCSGLKESLCFAGIYADFSDLFSLEAYREVESEIDRTSELFPSRKRELRKIRALILERHLDARGIKLADEIANFESKKRIHCGDAEIPLVQTASILEQEPDILNRHRVAEEYNRALRESEGLRVNRIAGLQEGAERLGFRSCFEARGVVTGVDYRAFSDTLATLLTASEGDYLDELRNSIGMTLGFPLEQAQQCDVGYWLRKNEPVGFFRAGDLFSSLENTVKRLGIGPERPGAIAIDLEARPMGQRVGLCIPIRIPHEIIIAMRPRGGPGDYVALFHGSGQAHYFAWTSPDLPIELRIPSEWCLAETYGFLFEHLLRHRTWLREIQGYADPGEFLRFSSLHQAYRVRVQAARLSFMVQGGGVRPDSAGLYSELLTSYTGLKHVPEDYLAHLEDGPFAADCLRGWTMEAMLSEHLRTRFGSDWYNSRAAGRFLKEIWETGQSYSADELSREIGLGTLDPQVLAGALREGLSR